MPSRSSAIWLIGRGIVILLVSGLAGAALVTLAPGFGVDERSLDARLSAPTLSAITREHEGERNAIIFYFRFLRGFFPRDFAHSARFGQPPRRLIREQSTATV